MLRAIAPAAIGLDAILETLRFPAAAHLAAQAVFAAAHGTVTVTLAEGWLVIPLAMATT